MIIMRALSSPDINAGGGTGAPTGTRMQVPPGGLGGGVSSPMIDSSLSMDAMGTW